jgi:hypothetical protein
VVTNAFDFRFKFVLASRHLPGKGFEEAEQAHTLSARYRCPSVHFAAISCPELPAQAEKITE